MGKLTRPDHRIIAGLVSEESRVLDLGCGEGTLLEHLVNERRIEGFGIEISESAIYRCFEKGLSVSHQDIDTGLKHYPEAHFDFVIFNQTMQQVHKPRKAIIRALKIGKTIIVGFPNFCNIRARIQITLGGRVPVTPSLPYSWYDTPNLHFLSIRDFRRFCRREGIRIRKAFYLTQRGRIRLLPNLLADNAIFVLEGGKAPGATV